MTIEKVGKFIAQERKNKGLTQNDLGQQLGVSGKAVSKWERGLNYPDISLLQKLANVLDLSVVELMNGVRNAGSTLLYEDQINQAVFQTLDFSKKVVYHQKKNYLILLTLTIVIFLFVFLLSRIDNEDPIIHSATLIDGIINVYATDNQEIDGYMLTQTSEKPLIYDKAWQPENVFKLTQSGRYYLWVKDKARNITGKPEYFTYRTTADQEQMLLDIYEHVTWLTPAQGIVTIHGRDYNRATMKVEYGDLYRFVEPLTHEEIELRFRYLAWWSVNFDGNSNFDPNSGLQKNIYVDSLLQSRINQVYKDISTSNDPKLSRFNEYIHHIPESGSYTTSLPEYFDCRVGVLCIIPYHSWQVTHEDKEYFVRNFTWKFETIVAANRELGIDLWYFWYE